MSETNFDFSVLETIPDTDAEIEVPEEVLEGPQTEEEQGVASLILDAISNSANTIQMYNAIIANCTDEEIIDSLNEILVDENRIMGKLQSILQKVSPNAEEIMNGAIEDSGIDESFEGRTNLYGLTHTIVDILNDSNELSDCDINSIGESFRITVNGIRYEYVPRKLSKVEESLNIINESLNEGCNNQELINAVQSVYGYNKKEAKDYIKTIDDKSKEELLKGFKRNAKKSFLTDSLKESSDSRWDNIDIEDWSSEMNSKTYQIERSIKTVLKKYPESKTKIISTAKSCRNILSNLCSNLHLLYNESLTEAAKNPYDGIDLEKIGKYLAGRNEQYVTYEIDGSYVGFVFKDEDGEETEKMYSKEDIDFYNSRLLESLNEAAGNQYGRAIPYQVSDDLWRVRLSNKYRDLTEYDIWGYGSTTKPKNFNSEIAAEDAAAKYNQRYEDIEDEFAESLEEDKKITRYSDVLPQKDRDRGWWYFTTHGVGPGTIPKDLNVLEIRDGQNKKGTWGTFVRLDGIVNTSELSYYDLTELAPPNAKNESLKESNDSWEEYYQTNILTDMFDADPSRFEQALEDFGYNPTNYDNFYSFLKDVDKVDLLNKFADLLQKNDELNSSWYNHFDFTEAPLPFDSVNESLLESSRENNESLILDESNNLDTSLDDITPVRDVHNERAIRDHKKYKEDRKKAFKEISKNAKDAFELDESLFESFYLNYEDSDLLQDWDYGGLDFSVDVYPYKYEFYTNRDANKALKIAISHGYRDSWREGHYVYLTAR